MDLAHHVRNLMQKWQEEYKSGGHNKVFNVSSLSQTSCHFGVLDLQLCDGVSEVSDAAA